MKPFSFWQSALALVAMLVLPSEPAAAASEPFGQWSPITCTDAAYGGRSAVHCTFDVRFEAGTKLLNGRLRVQTWANPGMQAQLLLTGLPIPRAEGERAPLDPIVLKLDGQVVRQLAAKDLVDPYIYTTLGAFSFRLAANDTFLNALASAQTLTIELTAPNGELKSMGVVLTSELGKITERTLTAYQRYYDKNGKPGAALPKPGPAAAIQAWGLLGEAADRSRVWVAKYAQLTRMLELDWVEPGIAMQVRQVWCNPDGRCGDYKWIVRMQLDGLRDNVPARGVIWHNAAGKRIIRYQEATDKGFFGMVYDPVLYEDMKSIPNIEFPLVLRQNDVCCISVGSFDYRPAGVSDVQQLIGEHMASLAQARAQEQSRMAAQTDDVPRDADGRPDLGPPPPPQRAFAQVFADAYQKQRQASHAQDLRQQQFLAGVAQSARAVERAQERGAQRDYAAQDRTVHAAREIERPRTSAEQIRPPHLSAQQGKLHAAPIPGGTAGSNRTAGASPVLAEQPPLHATLEAIMVCTKPSGPNDSFECRSPTDVTRGSAKDGQGFRTPEERVLSSEACPNPRRLPSTTHLVWGCGFGATNNGNSMDRSAGVDVKGRNTYYCHAKETSCRRISP